MNYIFILLLLQGYPEKPELEHIYLKNDSFLQGGLKPMTTKPCISNQNCLLFNEMISIAINPNGHLWQISSQVKSLHL